MEEIERLKIFASLILVAALKIASVERRKQFQAASSGKALDGPFLLALLQKPRAARSGARVS